MMKKATAIYPPLELLKKTSAAFPNAWEQMRDFHEHNGQEGLPAWESWCYAPMAAALAIASHGTDIGPSNADLLYSAIPAGQRIAALAPWRLSKEVFVLDPELKDLLFEQADDLDIPSELLLRLPYTCFYVELNSVEANGNLCCGFFVHLEKDINSGDRELRLLFLDEDGATWGFPIHIDESTIADGIARARNESFQNAFRFQNPEMARSLMKQPPEHLEELGAFLSQILQLVLYICASNAEIVPHSEQAIITKRGATVKDKYSEIRKWDVGTRIGSAIRRYSAQGSPAAQTAEDASGRSSPRPHMRRGHWHHYWSGPKSEPSKRELILKWTPPVSIGFQQVEPPEVIHLLDGGMEPKL